MKTTTFSLVFRRVLLLVIPIISILLWHYLTFDEHKYCTSTTHQHVDGFLGIAFLIIIWFFIWVLAILFEIIYVKLVKKN